MGDRPRTLALGTGFHPKCMAKLYKYMQDESNSEVMGVTGRQRVMTAEMQETDDGLVDWFLRLVQSADYESSYAITTGAYTLVGMLPVLPGPCALLRYEEVKDTVGQDLHFWMSPNWLGPVSSNRSNK